MVETGERMGKQMVALITDMDQPLGNMIGNALEVVEVHRGFARRRARKICANSALNSPDGCCISAAQSNTVDGRKAAKRAVDLFRARRWKNSARWWSCRAEMRE